MTRWGAPRALVLVVALLAMQSCRSGARSGGGAGPASTPRVIIDSPSGRSSAVAVEIARTPAEVERGLMFRDRLAPDAGMLFVFPEATEHPFWMKNTLIPLDMIFAGPDGTVVGVVENAEPLTTTSRTVGSPSRYVLEVNGGWSAAHGIGRGDRMRFEGVPDLR